MRINPAPWGKRDVQALVAGLGDRWLGVAERMRR